MTAARSTAPLMTEIAAAEWLACSTRTLRSLRQEGQIPYVQLKSGIRYTLDDLQAFVESQRTCRSTNEKAPPSGGCPSRSPGVLDFEEARARRMKKKRAG